MAATLELNAPDDGAIVADPEVLNAIAQDDKLALNTALDAQFARLDSQTAVRLRDLEKKFKDDGDARELKLVRDNTGAVIKAHLDGIPEDGALNLKARGELQELRLSALTTTDEDKDQAWHVERAGEIVRLHQEERRKAGGDGAQVLPEFGPGDVRRGERPRQFSLDALMLSAYASVQEHGTNFDWEKLTGSPEADALKDMAKQPWCQSQLSQVMAEANSNQRVIPVPSAVFRPDLRLAETYATAVTAGQETREPTFRRDLLIDHFRPLDRLMFLGVMLETISNDQSLPRITGAHAAGWLGETSNAAQGALTVATPTTRPRRLGVIDDVSWMRLAGGDSQFGVIPIVSSEMQRAVNQAKENAVYNGTGSSNQPTGIRSTTNVVAGTISDDPTYTQILNFVVEVAEEDIPAEMFRFITTWRAARKLATVLTFAASSSAMAIPLWKDANAEMIARIGAGFGSLSGYPAAQTTQLPTNLNTDEHAIIGGVFPYTTCFDYATAFITIDDISKAISAQTRLAINSFHDVICRVPTAFVAGSFNPDA